MSRSLFLAITIFLSGCVTNQMHFAPYSTAVELSAVKSTKIDVEVTSVFGARNCIKCTESDKIVWHAANSSSGLYEGFSKIPVDDWKEFIRKALGSAEGADVKVEVEIHRIFLKTWQNPQYYASQSEINIYIDGRKYHGKSMIKIKGSGQDLLRVDLVQLNTQALEAVQLSLKSAYINALRQVN